MIGRLLLALVCIGASGVPGLVLGRRSALGQWIAAALNGAGSILGCMALAFRCRHPDIAFAMVREWALPIGALRLKVDDLSLLFLIPIFLISALGSIYGLEYWKQAEHPANGRKLRLSWGLISAAMGLVVIAGDGIVFLMAWEIMALAAFFLVDTEENRPEVRDAAWVYLIAAHVSTLCLFGFFTLLACLSGSFELWPTPGAASPGALGAMFVLGTIGFGLKCGLMPLHVWLPNAHANAPSHVSAILSGVLLKMGVYGIMRIGMIIPHPPTWFGATLVIAGTLSGVIGIAFAAGQTDIKRLLAYSSIENIGIIAIGIGLALLGRSLGRADWVVLGLAGALLHVLNHSFFKPLLFMGAGSILHATHTREMDRLGGLGKTMPGTYLLFLVGALAICGLPPLNGFIGELFIYLGLFRTLGTTGQTLDWTALAAPALALVGTIAVAVFVKAVGTVFLGSPRTERAEHAHDPRFLMFSPMAILASACVFIGIFPAFLGRLLDRAVADWGNGTEMAFSPIANYVRFEWLFIASVILFALCLGGYLAMRYWRSKRAFREGPTWDCGYARSSPRIQYTASSFSRTLVELLGWVLWPRTRKPKITGPFPRSTAFSSDLPDVVLDRLLRPAFRAGEWVIGWARVVQRGPIQVYLLYVAVILLLLICIA